MGGIADGLQDDSAIEVTAVSRHPDFRPGILIVTTAHLASTAQLAMEMTNTAARVHVLAPPGHPCFALDCLTAAYINHATRPLRSLRTAIQRAAPTLVIPGDERVVRLLHTLHATGSPEIQQLIERSLGPPKSFGPATMRHDLLSAAKAAGVRVPHSAKLSAFDDLQAWARRQAFPWVLKADGSWAGQGVRIVRTLAEAEAAWQAMTRPVSPRHAFREMILERDYFWMAPLLRRETPQMSVQSFVDGWPANCAVACWQGEVVAGICAESVSTYSSVGSSTVARLVDNPEMLDFARRVVAKLRLSGLVGFDFMIEASTGAAHMIEMNPRLTPIAVIRMGPGRDLAEALLAHASGREIRERPAATEHDVVAFFPYTWRQDPDSPYLQSGYHNVPWSQPALVRALMKPELRDRYWFMRVLRKLWLQLRSRNSG